MRKFIRHPSDIPIEVQREAIFSLQQNLKDIGNGGLSFSSGVFINKNTILTVKILVIRPVFEARGRVVWCERRGSVFDVGLEFIEAKDLYKIRMIEQVCYIEHYKREIRRTQGRVLTGEQAAHEWIDKYARNFPDQGIEV